MVRLTDMTRTFLVTALLALLAFPLAVAQQGPPPGADPVEYAQAYAADEVADAQADPLGYAQGTDPVAEAEHAAWLACWTAYEAADHALDAACSRFFTAPVQVDAPMEPVTGEITEVLDDTGASAFAAEVTSAVQDTLKDPATALDQVQRILAAGVELARDVVAFVLDILKLAGLGMAAGLLGAAQGLASLAALPLDGLDVASAGLADVGSTLAGLFADGAAFASDAASAALDGVAAAAMGLVHVAEQTSGAAVDGVSAAAQGLADGVSAAAQGVASTASEAADAVQDAVATAVDKVASLFDGKAQRGDAEGEALPQAPKTGTQADGLLDRLLGGL